MFSLLLEASAKATNITKYVSIGVIVIMLAIIVLVAIANVRKKTYDTKSIAFGAICIALSFVLSFVKIAPVTYGGSITLASFVPILIYAYVFGITQGTIAGIIFGLLNFVTSPYILTPVTFVLDYILAFASIGLMGIFHHFEKSTRFSLCIGTVLVYTARFIFHLISGIIYFNEQAIWVNLPVEYGGFVYSFLYNAVYILPDCLIAVLAMFALSKAPSFIAYIKKITKRNEQENITVAQTELQQENVDSKKTEKI